MSFSHCSVNKEEYLVCVFLNLTIIPRNQQKCDTKFKRQLMDGDTKIETSITECSAERADSEKYVEVADSYIT